jgi:hypothetical protein
MKEFIWLIGVNTKSGKTAWQRRSRGHFQAADMVLGAPTETD